MVEVEAKEEGEEKAEVVVEPLFIMKKKPRKMMRNLHLGVSTITRYNF